MNKKILLISQRSSEATTNSIIDWIVHHKGDFIRLNGHDFYKNCNISIKNGLSIHESIKQIDWERIGVVWFRRWMDNNDYRDMLIDRMDVKGDNGSSVNKINKFLFRESKVVLDYIFYKIGSVLNVYDKLASSDINKLIVLDEAIKVGLTIPSSSIITKKDHLQNEKKKQITKPLANGNSFEIDGEKYSAYTALVDSKIVPDEFVLSLVQTHVEKEFEIRSFLLDNKIYSMAIFSQENTQTQVDFRKYDNTKPNRTIPFKVPHDIEVKLITLAKNLKLKTGSFDMIYSKEKEYIFLEVNPGGQFGMVSYPCNYYLEEKLALQLIKESSTK